MNELIVRRKDEAETMLIRGVCSQCHYHEDFEVAQHAYDIWKIGMLIQNCFPELNPDQRELLISGTCGKCFDAMWKDTED